MDRWLLVYVGYPESMCVFAPLADDIDWRRRIGLGADLEPFAPGPQPFARWVAPDGVGVAEERMEFESFVGRRFAGSRVTREDELRELLAALPHVPEATTAVDVVGIARGYDECAMVRRSAPPHVRTLTFRANHRCTREPWDEPPAPPTP